MKKILSILAIACSLFASTATFAQMKGSGQEAATNKGDFILDFGVGVGGGDYNGFNHYNYSNGNGYNYGGNWNDNYSNKLQIPTFSISLQKAFWDDITIGGEIAFNAFGSERDYHQNDDYYQHSKYAQTNTFILARGEYHFNRLIGLAPKYDLYAGVNAGARISMEKQKEVYEGWGTHGQIGSWRNDYADRTYSNVGPAGGLFAGFRLYFTQKTAVYAEVGVGSAVTNIRAGLAWRL
ncbi:hypothetical protein [uncultured Cytophaga sp.]|uniref:hypothetical protein n=1 Tax=uncultured Cytophaga sp. TaxID=160238 RepID=UPI002607B90F|nr:hypothetical protein [uncultured Cytophaga sp.]